MSFNGRLIVSRNERNYRGSQLRDRVHRDVEETLVHARYHRFHLLRLVVARLQHARTLDTVPCHDRKIGVGHDRRNISAAIHAEAEGQNQK